MSLAAHRGVCGAGALVSTAFVLSPIVGPSVLRAAHTGITIQTARSGLYKGTQPLTRAILVKFKGTPENSDDRVAIGRALGQLKDGDILALTVHSNQNAFGPGDEVVPWADFWKVFNITRPPSLATVIIGAA